LCFCCVLLLLLPWFCCAGLLSSMHASLVPVMQAITQQWSSAARAWTPCTLVFDTVRAILRVTDAAFCEALALVPAALQHTAVHGTRLMLGQLQDCGALLAAATTSTGVAGSSSSSSSSSSNNSACPHRAYVDLQCAATGFIFNLKRLFHTQQLSAEVALQLTQLLVDQASQELLLQPLVARVMLLHKHHEAQQQQQQQHKAVACCPSLPST
jgi:hypothetical protein